MNLISRIGDQFKVAFITEIIAVFAGGILVFLLARLLEPNMYGLLFFALSILNAGKLLSVFGIPKSAGRYITEYKETDPGQIPHIVSAALKLNIATIFILSVVFLLGNGYIASLVREPAVQPFLLLGSLFIIANTLFVFIRWILQGFEEIKAASVYTALNRVLRLIFVIVFVLIGYGAIGALVGYILGFAITAILGFGYLFKCLLSQYTPSKIESNLSRRIAKYSSSIAVTQSGHMIDNHIDTILIGFFAGPVSVAYYTLGKQILHFIETPMTALGFTLSPTYAAQKAQGNKDTASSIYENALSKGLLLYIPAAAGLIILAEPIVLLIFGSEYSGAVPVLQIFAILVVLQSVTKLTSHGLDYLGRAKMRAVIKIISAVLNVILNIILIPIYGATGAAVATVLTFSLYTLVNVYIMTLELDLRLGWLLCQIGYTFIITAIMSAIVYYFSKGVNSIIMIILLVCLGIIIWSVLIFTFGLVRIHDIKEVI